MYFLQKGLFGFLLFFLTPICLLAQDNQSEVINSDQDRSLGGRPGFDEISGPNTLIEHHSEFPGAKLDENKDQTLEKSEEQIQHEKIIEALIQRLNADQEKEKLEAVIALVEIAKKEDVQLLVQSLKTTKNLDASAGLIKVLGKLGDRSIRDTLLFEFKNGDPQLRPVIIQAFGDLKETTVVQLLINVLRDSDDLELKKRAMAALVKIGNPESLLGLKTSRDKIGSILGEALNFSLAKSVGLIDEDRVDTEMPAGRRKLRLVYKGTRYFLYHPSFRKENSPKPRVLVCIHGADLQAEALFELCQPIAKAAHMALIVPLFDNLKFPQYSRFNIEGQRSDQRLFDIVEHVSNLAKLESREIFLFGYGQGGDFAQRIIFVYPNRIARAALYLESPMMPNLNRLFPFGMQATPYVPQLKLDLYGFIKSDVAVLLSEESREARKFFNVISVYAENKGITQRVVSREINNREIKLTEAWRIAVQYLFQGN